MQLAILILGVLLLLAAIFGFMRSFWRPAPKRERDIDSPTGYPGWGYGSDSDAGGTGHGGL